MRLTAWTNPGRALACLALSICTLPARSADMPVMAGGDAKPAAEAWPAARRHVRMLDGLPFKFTSRLARVVELNFTFANGHQSGKAVIAAALDRLATAYGGEGNEAFTVLHIKSGNDGATGPVPDFTLDDLLSGEVIVANNIGMFNSTSMSAVKREAIRIAIETEGRGFFAFHGSGEAEMMADGWAWLTEQLIPSGFQGHTNPAIFPVYKHLEESRHIVIEGLLDANVAPAEVPDELDASGQARLAQGVPTRRVRVEPYRFARDIFRDPAYRDRATLLLKYDARTITDLLPHFKRDGGNMLAYLLRVGAGMTSYFQQGHGNEELLAPATGFDGGVGDFDRYVAQTLFFLAGYRQESCDSSCLGLPLVDGRFHATGDVFTGGVSTSGGRPAGSVPIRFESTGPGFHSPLPGPVSAVLMTTAGRVVRKASGQGPFSHAFPVRGLSPGIYLLRVQAGAHPARTKAYRVGD